MTQQTQDVSVSDAVLLQKKYMDQIHTYLLEARLQPKALVVTFGCQQNENDSERIRGMLCAAGYSLCSDPQEADLIIYNTCAVRDNAEQKVYGKLGALKHLKRKKPSLLIGVCGCMMQQQAVAELVRRRFRHVDFIFGTHTLFELPQLLYEALNGQQRRVHIRDIDGIITEGVPILRESGACAYVSVMYGCNNFCSYCIVPYVRGRERSRKKDDILDEIRQVAAQGYREIMLLGQNVNSYGRDIAGGCDFADLLLAAAEVEGIERIRFMTSHPKDLSERLMQVIASCDKVCRQLHLPVQAGSNSVLRDMNRGYTREQYLEKIKRMRELVPDIALTTDIIVGFPTETDADFLQTVSLLEQVRYDQIFSFIYSKRTGTPAAKMEPALTEAQIHKNFDTLLKVQNDISAQISQSYVGKVYKVLIEGKSKTDAEMISGRTESGKIVHMRGSDELCGELVDVYITSAKTWFLTGEIR